MPTREQHDVLVVGGGVYGLTAAIDLAAHGVDVRVVEARSRLGGRIATDDVAGLSVETGGEFLDAVDSPFARLLGALDVELEPALHEKQPERGAVVIGGEHVTPSAPALELVAALDAEIERIAGSLDPDAALALIEECAELAAEASTQVDQHARAALEPLPDLPGQLPLPAA